MRLLISRPRVRAPYRADFFFNQCIEKLNNQSKISNKKTRAAKRINEEVYEYIESFETVKKENKKETKLIDLRVLSFYVLIPIKRVFEC